MAFDANRILADALNRPTPVVLRDYEQMLPFVGTMVVELERAEGAFRSVKIEVEPHDDQGTCEACTVIGNMQLRYFHDLGLVASLCKTFSGVHARISQPDVINKATTEDLLSVCLITRAVLDNLVRSSAMFLHNDIRVYNKCLAESLTSIQKLVWSTLPHSISESALPLLDDYKAMSGSQRNDSVRFADPFPTFVRKIDFLKERNTVEGFNALLEMIADLYGALSDLVHGGIASLAIANPSTPQIVVGRAPLKYTPFTYQVAELCGISIITVVKAFSNLYVPILIQSLGWIEGTERARVRLTDEQMTLADRISDASF